MWDCESIETLRVHHPTEGKNLVSRWFATGGLAPFSARVGRPLLDIVGIVQDLGRPEDGVTDTAELP